MHFKHKHTYHLFQKKYNSCFFSRVSTKTSLLIMIFERRLKIKSCLINCMTSSPSSRAAIGQPECLLFQVYIYLIEASDHQCHKHKKASFFVDDHIFSWLHLITAHRDLFFFVLKTDHRRSMRINMSQQKTMRFTWIMGHQWPFLWLFFRSWIQIRFCWTGSLL